MELFFKRWVLLVFVIIIGGFFLVTIGQSTTTDKSKGKITVKV